ncbi:MAG: hypothetical protein GY913_18410 [Proteobacteria bacterium]|nr:hypothetical protein [Pseudomonadota bacterium]MCP4918883.1 hypothetical protein [Pseudomonadota bacterium]
MILALLACTAGPSGPCQLERSGDWVVASTTLDDVALEIVADGEDPREQSPVVVLGGGFASAQVPSGGSSRLPAGDGFVQVRTDLPADFFGEDSRTRVARVVEYAAGGVPDDDGCTIEERVPRVDAHVVLVGESNGGNLAIATLAAEPDLPVSALVTWETPAGPQFILTELVLPETGACTVDPVLACEVDTSDLAWDGRPWLDRDGDGERDDDEPLFDGLELADGRLHSPQLLADLGEQSGVLSVEAATAWFAWREASHLAPDVQVPAIVLGSSEDHAQVLPDSPHVVGLAGSLGGWVRLNPGRAWTGLDVENAPGDGLDLDDPGVLVDLDKRLLIAAGVAEVLDRSRDDDWSG